MRAAVIHEYSGTPVVEEFPSPEPATGESLVRVRAASLNPADLSVATGGFPFRRPEVPFVAGNDGVGETEDGLLVYFEAPRNPYGSLAELTPVPSSLTVPLPEGIDLELAAALGVPGTASWVALENRARLEKGETALILGAGGAVGQVAVQAARLLGAGRVVAAGRSDATLQRARRLGADATVALGGSGAAERLRESAPDGYDVVLDLTWGEPVVAAIAATRMGARVIQVGNLAGAVASVNAPEFRNKGVSIIGHSNFLTPVEVRHNAIERLAQHAQNGEISMELQRMPLASASDAWERLRQGTGQKQVLVP